jgi:hypothetical protein
MGFDDSASGAFVSGAACLDDKIAFSIWNRTPQAVHTIVLPVSSGDSV